MATNSTFEKEIQRYLDEYAAKDQVFAEKYNAEGKSISGCCSYIIAEVRKKAKGGSAVMSSDKVFGMAIHYYDEKSVKEDKSTPSCQVVVARELTEKEKEEARKEAEKRFAMEQQAAIERAKAEEVERRMREMKAQQEAERKKAEAAERKRVKAEEARRQAMEQGGLLFSFEEEE